MELLDYLSGKNKKKYINNLIISEHQYSNKLIEKNVSSPMKNKSNSLQNSYEYIENVEVLIDRMLDSEQEHIFNYMLHKVSESAKILKLNTIEKDYIDVMIEKKIRRNREQARLEAKLQ